MTSKKQSQSSVKLTGDVGTKTIQLQEGDDSKTAIIGAGLGDKKELELVNFLRANRDVFAWKPADMPGVPKELIEHALKVDPKAIPKKSWQNYSQLGSSRKSTTLIGWPTLCSSRRRTTTSGGRASTTLI